jgi:adenylate cyclase
MAQESTSYPTPWIQEIKLLAYYADIPNVSFYLDQLGNLYLGKENGVSIMNENCAVHLYMDGPVFISGNSSDTVYYTCRNDVGFLIRDPDGKFSTRSFKKLIPRIYRDFIPSQLICDEQAIFLNSDQGIYHLENGRTEIFPYSNVETRLFKVDHRFLLKVNGMDLLEWSGEGFVEIPFQQKEGDSPAKLMDLINTHPDVTFIGFINNKEALVVSPDEGAMIIDSRGRIIRVLGNKKGLPDRDIRQIMVRSDELWLLGPHTLHKINHPSSLDILEMNPDIIGRIFTSIVTDSQIVLGTSKGVFVMEPQNGRSGQWIIKNVTRDAPGTFYLLDRAGDRVFAAGTNQLVQIQDGIAEVISNGNFTGLQAIQRDRLIASGQEGIYLYNQRGNEWDSTTIYPSLSFSYSFARYMGSVFFLCKNEAFRLSNDLEKLIQITFHREESLFRLIPMDGELYLMTDVQVYQFEESEETFLPLSNDHKARIMSASDIIIPDETGGYWMVRNQGKYKSQVIQTNENLDPDQDSKTYPILQYLGEIIDLDIRDSVLYLTGMDQVTMFDLKTIEPCGGCVPVRVESVHETDQGRTAGFYLAGLEFQSVPEPVFRYRLEPDQETWSEWDTNRSISFDRLRPGDYTLEAQAKDLYGRTSNPAVVRFSIKAPFYITWYALTFYGFVLLVILFLIQKMRLLSYQRVETRISQRMQTKLDDLTVEKEKSDKLVAEVLPEKTAAQIRSTGKAKWDKYDRATVLFSDIQGFTKIAEEMNPEALIDELDKFFFHFDSVVEKYNIEKIKTIGDAYMAAGGIPEKNSTNPVEVVLAALEMQAYMQQLKSSKTDIWDLRIGIHTGPVIAGVVGHKKISYDIWGDTVNTASRMESSGMPGKVNISGITYGMVKEYFICEYRGKLPVKYKGNIDMYFVNGLRPELAVDLKGIPNKRFFTKLQLLRIIDLEERIFETILTDLPSSLYFHRLEYAQRVYNQAFLLCRAEEVDQEDRLLVRTAALILFTGLTQAYHNFENRSSVIARELLPGFKYSETQIDQVCNLILATKQPFHPNNLLEKILIDAKMEYIGRPDYPTQIKLLFQEILEAGTRINGQQFKKQQLELLYEFDFFTLAAKRLREVPRESQMTILEQERWI